MTTMLKEVKIVKEEGAAEDGEPVSPTGQYFNSSALSVAILAIFDFDAAIDDSPTMSTLRNLFLPLNPRFSSVMTRDENGAKQWRRVRVKLEEHVNVPVFPPGLESYDDHLSDYISKIAMEQLPQNKPLWNIHIIKYPTSKSAGTLVFKLHHALGDGFSLMAALFSCLTRADDPSLPLTFPRPKPKPKPGKRGGIMEVVGQVPRALSVCVNTVRDFGWSLLKSNFLEDDRSAIRSGTPGIEFMPITIASVEFFLDDIRKIKAKTGGTINDVICGVVFYGTQLYLQAADRGAAKVPDVTALVLLNTRVIDNYQPVNAMTKCDAESPWGNQFGFIHVAVPGCRDAESAASPLEFVQQARQIIKRKRSSLGVHLTGRLLELLRRLIGPEATAKYVHATLKNTSMTISNLTGPMEQMLIAGHPVRSFHFMVVGVPQSLTITVVSYMGKMKLAMGVEKGYINPALLVSCMEQSFESIFEAAAGK